MSLRRTVLTMDQYVRAPIIGGVTGPICALCTTDEMDPAVVDSEEMVDCIPGHEDGEGRIVKLASGTSAFVLVKHHGCEELCEFDMGSLEWGPTDLKKSMQRRRFFVPDGLGEEGKLVG